MLSCNGSGNSEAKNLHAYVTNIAVAGLTLFELSTNWESRSRGFTLIVFYKMLDLI